MSWKVDFFPEELAFIDGVWAKRLNQSDGRGDFIAPLRGGIIYLSQYDTDSDEQTKWLIFNELQKLQYQTPGFVGIKFMNMNWNGIVPGVLEDPEAMDKWGVKRVTTDGQPIGADGYPLDMVYKRKVTVEHYAWHPEDREYALVHQEDSLAEFSDKHSRIVPEKLVD